MTVVTALHKSKSKFDFVHKGIPLQFDVEPSTKGVHVAFLRDMKLKDMMPEALLPMFGRGRDPEEVVEQKAVAHQYITLKWWEKFIGITLEKKVTKWATTVRDEWAKSETIADQIRTFVAK